MQFQVFQNISVVSNCGVKIRGGHIRRNSYLLLARKIIANIADWHDHSNLISSSQKSHIP